MFGITTHHYVGSLFDLSDADGKRIFAGLPFSINKFIVEIVFYPIGKSWRCDFLHHKRMVSVQWEDRPEK